MNDKPASLLADYLDEPALAKQLHVTPRTLQRWRRQRVGPAVTIIGRAPMYRIDSVRAWLLQQERQMVRAKRRA